MKIMVYEARPDERADLEKQAALHGVELSVTDAVPTLENASLAAGCAGVSILGQGRIDAALLDAYHALGISPPAPSDMTTLTWTTPDPSACGCAAPAMPPTAWPTSPS